MTDRAESGEEFRANAIHTLFTLKAPVNKHELYQSSAKMLTRLQQAMRVQSDHMEDLRHNVSVLEGLLQQNIQTAAKGDKFKAKSQEWREEREELLKKNEKQAADIINIKRQLQAAKVEAAAVRSSIGQNVNRAPVY